MPDLDTAIRARLDAAEDLYLSGDPITVLTWAVLADTIRALLDLHAAPERALPGEIHCGELIDWVQDGCPTVRAIAKALGVGADG